MFGINAALEIFQNTVAELLHGLNGCRNISDDIIVYGKTVAEHDASGFGSATREQRTFGLGAILTPGGKLISYASRTLTEIEKQILANGTRNVRSYLERRAFPSQFLCNLHRSQASAWHLREPTSSIRTN